MTSDALPQSTGDPPDVEAPPGGGAAVPAAARPRVRERLLRHLVPLAGLGVLAAHVLSPVLDMRAVDADNVFAASRAVEPWPPAGLTEPLATYLSAYRPLMLLSLWAQYQVSGTSWNHYFWVNIVLLVVCALSIYLVVVLKARSAAAASLAAALFLVDYRGRYTLWWIGERQMTMACLFGLLALLVAWRYGRRRSPWIRVLTFALLLLAALSKEYGLAFVPAVVVIALLTRPRIDARLAGSAIAAGAVYTAIRVLVGGATSGGYCEGMGLGRQLRTVCYGDLALLERLQQYAWNQLTTFAATFVPGMYDHNGVWTPELLSLRELFFSAALVLFVGLSLRLRLAASLPLVTLIVAGSALGFTVYRDRNLVITMSAAFVLAALGVVSSVAWLRARGRLLPSRVLLALAVLAPAVHVVDVAGDQRSAHQQQAVRAYGTDDYCAWLEQYPRDIDAQVAAGIRRQYGEPPLPCLMPAPG